MFFKKNKSELEKGESKLFNIKNIGIKLFFRKNKKNINLISNSYNWEKCKYKIKKSKFKIKNEIVCKYNKIKSGVDLVICYVSIENLCFII